MSDLTQEQLSKLKRALMERSRKLVAEVRNELEESGNSTYEDMAGQVGDSGDESVADLLTDLGATLVDRQIHQVREIEAARQRIQDGTYGVCIDCGLDIPFERLLAYPTALRDVQCQTQYEKNYAQEGRPTL